MFHLPLARLPRLRRCYGTDFSRARAFTLVELLVVIGVIAVLVGLLLPVLGNARERSRRTVCLANLRTLGHAMYLYSEAHRGRLPNGNPPGRWVYSDVLIGFAERWVREPRVFWCPGDRDPMPRAIWTSNYQWPNSAHVSYEFYSVWWPPEHGPMLVRMRGRAPLAWDLSGGAAHHNPRKRLFTNHGDAGGQVLYADGHGDWQRARDWNRENWPAPADEFYPTDILVRP